MLLSQPSHLGQGHPYSLLEGGSLLAGHWPSEAPMALEASVWGRAPLGPQPTWPYPPLAPSQTENPFRRTQQVFPELGLSEFFQESTWGFHSLSS